MPSTRLIAALCVVVGGVGDWHVAGIRGRRCPLSTADRSCRCPWAHQRGCDRRQVLPDHWNWEDSCGGRSFYAAPPTRLTARLCAMAGGAGDEKVAGVRSQRWLLSNSNKRCRCIGAHCCCNTCLLLTQHISENCFARVLGLGHVQFKRPWLLVTTTTTTTTTKTTTR